MDAKEFKRGDIERLRDEAQNCAGAGVKWMTITERPEAIAELAKIALTALYDAAQAPLTDEHILKAFRDAGIRFKYVGARDTVATQVTCGSQNAYLMVSAVRALLAAPIAADAAAPSLTTEQLEEIAEGREILSDLIENIEKDGPYSAEATITFLRQALNCLPRVI